MLRKVVKHNDTVGIRIEALLKLFRVEFTYVLLILTFKCSTICPQSVCMFLRKKTCKFSLHNTQHLVLITETRVYCVVRHWSINRMEYVSFLKYLPLTKYYTLMFSYQPDVRILILELHDEATQYGARLIQTDAASAMRGCLCPTRN